MFSAIYGRIMNIRNALYDKGVFEVHDLGARAISVGNITTGGTGKTPLVAHIAEILARNGEDVCILTRGYGRKRGKERVLVSDGTKVLVDAATGGDEPVELAQKLIGKAVVVADADRVSAARWAKRTFGVTAFILDDGFQHRRAKRDVDIVCIDATDPLSGGRMLPFGRLREPPGGLSRSDAIVITRSDCVNETDTLKAELREYASLPHIFTATDRIVRIRPLIGDECLNTKRRFFAFCGIGNPKYFFGMAGRDIHGELAGTMAFADHFFYSRADIDAIEKTAASAGADALVTTAKDAVKLVGLRPSMPCFVIEIAPEIEPAGVFEDLLTGQAHPNGPSFPPT